jgi:hypothetical protein
MATPPNAPAPQDDGLYRPAVLTTRPQQTGHLWEAAISFGLACVLIVLGASLIIWAFFTPEQTVAAAKAASGALFGCGGGYLVKVRKEARFQLEQIRQDENVKAMLLLIENNDLRDKAISDFVQNQMMRNQPKSLWKRITRG